MANTKDIKDFTKYPSLSDEDLMLGAKASTGGTDAAITVANFKKLVASDVVPQIKEGYWWINGVNTNIVAQGQTPVFRYTAWGLEYKYQYQDDAAYQKLIPFNDLTFTWDDLTPEQKKELEGPQGLSAYQVWLSLEGNAGKSEEDYLAYLRQPATEAAALALAAAETAVGRLNTLSDHRDEIRDGYWWQWNEETGEWYNTGETAKGNVMFATFEIDPATGRLTMFTDPEYTGADFEITEKGKLQIII